MKQLAATITLFLLLVSMTLGEGLNQEQEAIETVGGSWVSSSGAQIYVGATTSAGGITISVNGGPAVQGYIGVDEYGGFFFTYTSTDGTTMEGEYNSDGDVIYIKSQESSFTSMWRRN